MARLTELPLAAAQTLGAAFSVSLASVEPLDAGSVNSNFLLTAQDGGRYFARVYEEQDAAGAAREHALAKGLAREAVPLARGLETAEGNTIVLHGGKPFAMFPWLDGEILCQARVTPPACMRLGAALARVHLTSSKVEPLGVGRFELPNLRARLETVEAAGRPDLMPAVAQIRERLAFYEARRDTSLEQGICHGDLFRDNVLWQNGEILALLDFESACSQNFAYDLMVTALAWCYGAQFELGLLRALFGGYRAFRPLSPAEVSALPVEGAIACLRFATTRLTDFSLRAAPGAEPSRDYRRFLERLSALESGVLAPCFAELG
ncbi:MAG TPA: homoserine kinase [Polyangiaceae bacterium]|jgi:homoserine kinase type II